MDSFIYLIAFGGNTGDRVHNARGSLVYLQKYGRVLRQSEWLLTKPMQSDEYDTRDHEDYLNFVFEFETHLLPDELYARICEIEDRFGHERIERWRPRAVDFDLLFFCQKDPNAENFLAEKSQTFKSADRTLEIPHPAIWRRNFLLGMIESGLQISTRTLKKTHRLEN